MLIKNLKAIQSYHNYLLQKKVINNQLFFSISSDLYTIFRNSFQLILQIVKFHREKYNIKNNKLQVHMLTKNLKAIQSYHNYLLQKKVINNQLFFSISSDLYTIFRNSFQLILQIVKFHREKYNIKNNKLQVHLLTKNLKAIQSYHNYLLQKKVINNQLFFSISSDLYTFFSITRTNPNQSTYKKIYYVQFCDELMTQMVNTQNFNNQQMTGIRKAHTLQRHQMPKNSGMIFPVEI
eukprot:TRINITY_DN10942_c0_g1_i5.p1 TRINITY_DN10942_c0_g1~~TRINITY_DN10942_c0_g1_i5.p1  ORF type:complete len:236 (+),score=-28.17 TRINITY_DN10942_c0_g1_i5:235-942(+)